MPEWFLEYCIKSERFASQIQKTLMLSDSFFFFHTGMRENICAKKEKLCSYSMIHVSPGGQSKKVSSAHVTPT